MTIAKIDVRGGVATPGNWNDLGITGNIANLIAFSDASSTGWALTNNITAQALSSNVGANVAGTGDAAWVASEATNAGFRINDSTNWTGFTVGGFTGNVEVRAFVSGPSGRIMDVRVNGGTPIVLNGSGPNSTLDGRFTVTPVGGAVTVEFKKNTGSSGDAYINAFYVEEIAAADTTAPTFDTAPAVTATSTTGHTIASTLNETGTLYGVRLASGATAPSSAQVVAGQNNTGAAALEAVSVAATAATNANLVFSTGAASTAYDYYIVAQDDEGTPNLQAAPTLVSATTAATAVPGVGQLTVQFEGVAINVADWHIITRLVADQSIIYNQTGRTSNVSGNIAAFATTSGSVGDPVRVEGLSVADAYSFVIEQNLGNIA
jgi:hypothetical protein